MIQRRYHIRAGAKTTAGGTVRVTSDRYKLNGVPLALEGDPVDCPRCNTTGVIRCVAPRLAERFNGKQYALQDDLCICQCSPPPKLTAEQTAKCQVLIVAEQESREEAQAREAVTRAAIAIYDEQPKLAAPPIEGLPYHIETKDGRKVSGRTGPGGLLPRIVTESEGEYAVYWGDEALNRAEGSGA
jgi:uncharacterized Zn-binding protein involved in type VI secretion